MADIIHTIDGQDFGEPREWQDLEITVDWLNKKESGTVNVSELSFVEKANKFLQERILNGVSGGVGIFEGVPYKIAVNSQGTTFFEFEGYLDLTQETTVIGGEEIVANVVKKKGDDWLNDVARGFSFAYLYDEGKITQADFVKVPYVINYVPDNTQLILLSLSLFMMTKEIIENVESLAETVADVIDASTPVVGVGAGLGAVVVTAWDLGNFILVVLKALARLAYIIAMAIAITNLIQELLEQLLPKKRFHLGMTFERMFQVCCQHLGMSFSSDIEELKWVHIPRKDKKGGSSGERGFPTNTEPIYNFGDFIVVMKEKFNADYRIINNVFYFRRRDRFEFPSPYSLPRFFNNQERLLQENTFNTDEIVANYNIYYSLDTQDQNTLDVVDGRVFQAITSPVVTNEPDFVTIKNIQEIEIPFSLGLEKRSLTTIEEVAKSLGSVVDAITGIFGGGTNFASSIEQRIGSLLLSSHFLTVGKVVAMSGTKLSNNQREVLSVAQLWEKYHFINSFAEYNGEHNQFFIYKGQRVPMTAEEFSTILDNNKTFDDEGNEVYIDLAVYNPFDTTAVIDYRVKKKYTNNLKLTIV